jgi:hypothetical protein
MTAENGTAIVYTVPAGKTLFLCSVLHSYLGIAISESSVGVRNAADVLQYLLSNILVATLTLSNVIALPFWPPVEIPALYDITVASPAALAYARACITGWVE